MGCLAPIAPGVCLIIGEDVCDVVSVTSADVCGY